MLGGDVVGGNIDKFDPIIFRVTGSFRCAAWSDDTRMKQVQHHVPGTATASLLYV